MLALIFITSQHEGFIKWHILWFVKFHVNFVIGSHHTQVSQAFSLLLDIFFNPSLSINVQVYPFRLHPKKHIGPLFHMLYHAIILIDIKNSLYFVLFVCLPWCWLRTPVLPINVWLPRDNIKRLAFCPRAFFVPTFACMIMMAIRILERGSITEAIVMTATSRPWIAS